MNNTMESIISPQNYDTAGEESMSMYFSFSSTIVNEKTIIGEQLKHTINDNNEDVDDDDDDDALNEENKENVNTVIKKSEGVLSPFRAAPKNILQQFKTASATSTPTYKKNVENIEENMKSLGISPLDDGVNENFIEKREEIIETEQIIEEEELIHVDIITDEVMITIESDDSVQIIDEIEIENKTGHKKSSVKLLETSGEAKLSLNGHNKKHNISPILSSNKNAENILEENKENIQHFSTKAKNLSKIKEFSEDEENTSTPENVSSETKHHEFSSNEEHPNELKSAKKLLPKNKRLSIPRLRYSLIPPSEPDLQRNKPSRIAGNKQFSVSNLNQGQIVTQIPRLLSAVMTPIKKLPSSDKKSSLSLANKKTPSPTPSSSTSCINETDDKKVRKVETKKQTNTRKSLLMPPKISANKKVSTIRKSMMVPPTNKRLSIVKQKANPSLALSPRGPRKSGIVKTTLNSPAIKRNIRKSLAMPPPSMVAGNIKGRKSIFPATTSTNSNRQVPLSPSRFLGSIKGRKSNFPATSKNSNLQVPTTSRRDLKSSPEVSGINRAKITPTQPPSTSTLNHENFTCDKCLRTFRLLSTLETHKKTHSAVLNKIALKCKYCDKKFEVSKALENHLLEKCTKILASERRKLLTKMSASSSSSFEKSTSKRNNNRNWIEVGSDSSPSINSIGSLVNKSENDNDSLNMPPPSSIASSSSAVPTSSTKAKNLVPKKAAHSGVFRTPNKPVVCYPCNIPFDNAVCYTEHVLSHSSSSGLDS